MACYNDIGYVGEFIVKCYFEECGYCILEINWCYCCVEVDFIVMDGKILVFVEVKICNIIVFGEIEDFVIWKKEDLLIVVVYVYMEYIDYDWEICFDIIVILYFDE